MATSMTDEEFFTTFPERQSRIRNPAKTLVIDKQRHTHYEEECEREFQALGEHKRDRRRILLWRVPRDNPHFNPRNPQLIKIPMLAFADEEIADRDDVLLPILHELMQQQRDAQTWH